MRPSARARTHWTRRGIAEWLIEGLSEGPPTLVGIDHAFSFPLRYFEAHGLAHDWEAWLEDFPRHWPTDDDRVRVDFVRDGRVGDGAARPGDSRWRRRTEEWAGSAKSVFHFDVQGSVAKSTHAGLPWLRRLRRRLGDLVHVWPFDGWAPPEGRSVVAEVYPSLWSRSFAPEDRGPDQHDAWSVAESLRRADLEGRLASWLEPPLGAGERARARVEGWILGVCGPRPGAAKRRAAGRTARGAQDRP